MSRPTRTERRRAQLALKIASLEKMEAKSLITESLGILTLGIGVPAAIVATRAEGSETGQALVSQPRAFSLDRTTVPVVVVPSPSAAGGVGTGRTAAATSPSVQAAPASQAPTFEDLVPQANTITVASAAPANSGKGGGAGGSSHGGSGSTTQPVAAGASASAAPAAGSSSPGSTNSAPILPASTSPSTSGSAVVVPASSGTTAKSTALAVTSVSSTTGTTSTSPSLPPRLGSGGGGGGGFALDMPSFTNFPVYTLDENAGEVIQPGADQLATLGGNVDLRAQVSGTTVSSYSWNTSGLTDVTSISGSSTYDLTFQWDSSVATATTNSVTLTVTNASSQTEVQTYTFQVPAGSGTPGTGTTTWPTSLSPDTVSPAAPSVAAHNVSVDSNSGSLDTAITLPTYNPNVPAVVLSYDEQTANPMPLIVEHHTIDPTQAVPSQVSAQLTFDGTSGSTYYYDTSQLSGGDVQQIALQANATSLATGRYAYTVTTGDIRSSTTTTTSSGTTTVINDSGSAIGSGWVVNGLESITSASGGVILNLGSGGKSLWFATGSGSTYTDPAGEFSTLVADSGGGWTDTLTTGETLQFNSSGQEIADVDTNGVAITYGYDGSGRLSTIQDHYGNTTTFTYDGMTGLLDKITDPADRIATFTHSGTALSDAEMPDTSTWGYAYDGSDRLTEVTDPNSKVVTVVYDSAERVGTIANPDSTSETFLASQEQGFVPSGSGTSGSPAAATLLATATSNLTDQLGNETNLYPDWQGLGLTNVTSDPLGNISTSDRDGNGLATISIDPLNRTTQSTYDSHGNITHTTNPDGTTTSATYNSFAEPLTTTNELGHTTSYTYNSDADNTNTAQPLGVNATMTYSGTGQVTSDSNPAGYYTGGFAIGGSPSPGGGPISYTYDSQDRLISQEDALGEITTYTYNSASDLTSEENPDGEITSYTYDAMNRLLTTTDAAHDITTNVYDAAGNPTVVIDPLGNRTTTAYDSMDRVIAVTDALGGITSYTYDSDGRETSITDPDSNVTTYAYDADSRQVGSTNPNGYASTETYDADGEVIESVDADGHQIDYGYDAMGREVTESWINGTVTLETITMTYDAAGELTEETDGTTALTFTYDNDGRQTGQGTSGTSGQPAVALTASYYDSNARASLSDNLSSSGITTYGYDAAFRLASIVTDFDGSPLLASFGYDAAGNVTSLTQEIGGFGFYGMGSEVVTTYSYDVADRLTGITDKDGSGNVLDGQSYAYNANGDVTSETNAEGSLTYTYDAIDELTGVSGASTATYTYDQNGNRTMTGYSTGTGNETTAGAGYTYTYDHDGNLISETQTSTGDVTSYTWDYRNRLTGVVEENSSHTVIMQATYTYDAMDRRIETDETVSGTETKTYTVYDGTNPYADFNSSGTLLERYTYGPTGRILARTSGSGTTAWYLTDHLGTIRDVVDAASATVIDHLAYDSYGNVTSESDASYGDRFKFDGMAWDAAIGLYYDNARYYNPTSGRFIEQDPTSFSAGDSNLYRFCSNNTPNEIDPSGKSDSLDKILPAWVIINPGVDTVTGGTWQAQPGVGTGPPVEIDQPGTYKPVDGIWLPTGYLKIPTGAVVTITGPPLTPLGPPTLVTSLPVQWYPITVQNPQGNNPTVPGDNNGPKPKPVNGPTIIKPRNWPWWMPSF